MERAAAGVSQLKLLIQSGSESFPIRCKGKGKFDCLV